MPDPTTPVSQDDPWIRRYVPRPGAAARIVCFGPAGGSPGFYRDWCDLAPADVEVQVLAYPGRERRFLDEPIEDMGALADAVHDVLAPRMDRPTVLFGHSMGASVAFETARRLEASGAAGLAALVVSGRPSPRTQREIGSEIADFDDDRIVEHLHELGGTPPGLLDDPDARELILPAFRSDFRLIGRYAPAADARISTPLAVLHGDQDPKVTTEDARYWAEAADRVVATESMRGGHFYLLDHGPAVVGRVLDVLRTHGSAPAGAP
ncbi:thioesterase II family protein [Kitasatospora sp. NPDC094019]|uniref:thioesterase II family protein n=1 Tax=Kitasatospora sp. NPDC094019 TaxID=3364091 RepID=UPI00381A15F7